jgi:hypothetical protein
MFSAAGLGAHGHQHGIFFFRASIVCVDMIQILNVSLVRMSVGPMCLADLFPYLSAVNLVHHIYTSCKPYGRARGLIIFSVL